MRIIATAISAKDLEPGDLFSSVGPEYWEGRRIEFDAMNVVYGPPLGEKVYIRTDTSTPPEQAYDRIYKITIEK